MQIYIQNYEQNTLCLSSDALIEDVSVVRLDASEGAPILGVIEDVCESENAYYIVSSDMVYRYAKDGSFVMRIGAKGRGPGEYLNPRGIEMSDGRLYVFDYNTQNILTYGEDGSFISSSSQSALMNSGIYLSSFFFSGGDMILYYSSNSPVQDMLRWDAASDELAVISRRSREMLPLEVIIGDMRLGKYRYEYSDLTFEGMMSLSAPRMNILWIAAAGESILIAYSIVNLGDESSAFLGLYNTRTGEYSQNVEITGIPEDFAVITPAERLFEGMQDDELLSVRPVSDTGDEYVIIKYRFSTARIGYRRRVCDNQIPLQMRNCSPVNAGKSRAIELTLCVFDLKLQSCSRSRQPCAIRRTLFPLSDLRYMVCNGK